MLQPRVVERALDRAMTDKKVRETGERLEERRGQ